MLICILTGFASGLPLYLLLNLVPAWLKTEGLSLKAIGAFALIQFPYTWKFVWAPLLDRYGILPWLGRRRSWMFVAQVGLLAAIAWLGQLSPVQHLPLVVGLTVVAFGTSAPEMAVSVGSALAGSPDTYTRHLVHADPYERFSVMLLVWRPGQNSPVHGHRTWCAYRVLRGTLSERHYRWNPENRTATQVGAVTRETGGRDGDAPPFITPRIRCRTARSARRSARTARSPR